MVAPVLSLDPFEALGVPRDASTATIKARWKQLCRRYHPNRHQGPDESKHGLTEHFLHVQQAWKTLSQPDNRRRYVELLDLLDTQNAIWAGMADLLEEAERKEHRIGSFDDGNVSSDADEDALPTLTRRKTTLERSVSVAKHREHLGDPTEPAERTSPRGRIGSLLKRLKERDSGFQMPALRTRASEAKEDDYFALRRKKLEKLRRREGKAFFAYRDAMLRKFEAELEVERHREAYDTARWKRDYFERAPRETAERFKSFQRYMAAVQAFNHPRSTSRRRSTAAHAGQILSTDETFQGQHLLPGNIVSPTRRKTLHQRGWSSDISGDQTSSDEDSSDGRMSRASASSWLWQRLQGQQHSLDAIARLPGPFPPKWAARGDGSPSGSDLPDQGPFKLLVKRPTGFAEGAEPGKKDSSPDSSSRSPSPSPERASGGSLHKFSLMRASRIAEFLGASHDRSWLQGLDSTNESSRSKSRSLRNEISKQFEIKHVGRPQFHDIPVENVHLLSNADKRSYLGTLPDTETSPEEIMVRLRQLDSGVAQRFIVKPDIMEEFNFRLIYGHKEIPRHNHGSFIALSYRRKRHVKETEDRYTLPLEPEIFQALSEERLSESEGIWIDQICIDQQSEREKVVSMSAMDLVYRSARVAVVVLDDIELEAYQGEILRCHMDEYDSLQHVPPHKRFRNKQPPYLEVKEDLYHVLQILLQSSWFKRAWCRHEMRLARRHIFLIPVRSPGTWTGMNVVRFTSHCLSHLLGLATEVPFDPSVETVKPALQAFFRDRSKVGPDETLKAHHGNFTTVVAEVFAMEAGGDPRIPVAQRAADALKDKISIILNTMECGLALAPSVRRRDVSLSKAECHYMLLMLALSARDPTALCSVGPPMAQADAATPTVSNTWLFEPTNVDSGLNNYKTRQRLDRQASIETDVIDGEHFVQLDLKFLQSTRGRGHDLSSSSDHAETLALANRISVVCFERRLGRNRHRYLISDRAANRHFGDMREVYETTLACVLECGPDWMEAICHRYGVSRWRQDLRPAYELLIALKNTVGKWPESAWSNAAVGFLMDFVNFIVIRGLPQRQILHHEEWRPIAVELDNGGRVLTFVAPGKIHPAVPTALLETDYVQLACLWVLQHREMHHEKHRDEDDSNGNWRLLGKSILFSDDLAMQRLHSPGGIRKEKQRVFGRGDTRRNSLERTAS